MAKQPTLQCRAAVLEAQAHGACHASTSKAEQRQLKRMAQRGELVCPITGIFASASWWAERNPNERALAQIRGLAKKHPEWVFCDMSAALVHGLWVPFDATDKLHILTPRKTPSKNSSTIVRHFSDKLDFEEIDGIRVTPLARTAFDCCRSYPVRTCLGVADSALRLLHRDSLWLKRQFQGFSRHHKGWKQASIIASLANPLAENGGESFARATMVMLGFQMPKLQVEIQDPICGNTYRLDFCWDMPDGTRVAGELDGKEKYTNPNMTGGKGLEDVLIDERLRESRINALRIPVARFSIKDVREPARLARILDAYGVPRVARKPKLDTSRALNWQVLKLGEFLIEYEIVNGQVA